MVRVFASCLRGCCCYCLVVKSCLTLCDPWTVAHQASLSMGFPSKNTGVDCHFLLQGIFLTQGSNQCLLYLLHCRQILYLLSHQGIPLILSFLLPPDQKLATGSSKPTLSSWLMKLEKTASLLNVSGWSPSQGAFRLVWFGCFPLPGYSVG